MKICWDNLEKLQYSKTGKWYKKTENNSYIYYRYVDHCKVCNEPFLIQIGKKGIYCSNKCFHKNGRNKEYRENLSLAASKRFGIKNPNYNNIWIEEQKRNQSKRLKGNRAGEKRPEHSLKMYGSGNPNWQGGISYEPYCEAWNDNEYKYSIRERDNNKCQNPYCNKKTDRLCIHHIDYNKKNCHPDNLITLCFSCNAKANFDRDIWQSLYEEMIRNK